MSWPDRKEKKLKPRIGTQNIAALTCFILSLVVRSPPGMADVLLSFPIKIYITFERKMTLKTITMMTGTPRNQLLFPMSIQQ